MNAELKSPPSLLGQVYGFISLSRRQIASQWAYRGAILMALVSNGLGYAVLLLVWKRAYSGNSMPPTFPANQLFSYLALAFIMNFCLSLMVEVRFGSRLQTGMIAIDITRPLGCMPMQLAQGLGEALACGVVALLLYLIAWCKFGAGVLPPSTACACLGLLSTGLAFLVNFSISYLAAQSLFVTLHFYGITQSRLALHYVFSGLAAPLGLFPPKLRAVANALPFRHVVETPVRIGLGLVPPSQVGNLLLQQVAWTAGLLLMAWLLFRAGLKRLQIHGG